ncbi:hypothetical protein [Alicyclobacillus fastidiosus]|uniref:Uncharacterized protein n=1 Tax=Alicyclobacillus fastidiosus TaxID=392011 RepID=A0ABV5AKI1_9BACL|nr:hypothetical protein [Alicyclobacillus fastidiosus]WEH08191.1 hypothetical protein PYS47_15910 [Alicyclobacillus fastidiosus]
MPYKDANGKPDKAHVENALARLDQTQIPAAAKQEAFGKLKDAAKEVGVTVDETRKFADNPAKLKIPVGRIGEWNHPRYGRIKMSQDTFDQMRRNFQEKTIGRDPFIRIGHNKSDDPTFGASKAEGWITDLVQEGDILYALADPTNPEVANLIQSKQYRYASPEYLDNYRSKEDGSSKGAALEALSLTNEPFLTRLPEARLLADPPDMFYLDYEEVKRLDKMDELLNQQKESNGLMRKLADFFMGGGKPTGDNPAGAAGTSAPATTQTPEQIKLAEMESQMAATKLALRTSEVDRKLAEYTAQGIPPAVLQSYRPILLADDGAKTIKLADEKGAETMVSTSDQIYATLDAYPQEARVKLAQIGEQHTPPTPDSPEAIKKLADETMQELGYTVDEQGRYKLV